MRKLAFCICENKGTDQLRYNRSADQCLCFSDLGRDRFSNDAAHIIMYFSSLFFRFKELKEFFVTKEQGLNTISEYLQ